LIGFRHIVRPIVPASGTLSLADRRHAIARRRHGLAHGIGWGAATLVAAWLLLSGIVGFAHP
jgi:hypothetical protein